MTRTSFLTLCLAVAGIAAGAPAQTPDADALLRQAENSRTSWTSFSVITTITNFKDGEQTDQGRFEVMSSGDRQSLVRFLNPDEKGRFLLMSDDAMWIYMPSTRRPIRITPLQRLMGNASNGDVANLRYTQDYTPRLLREERVGSVPCHVLELTARNESATYQRIEYWIARADGRPVKAEMFLSSGRHIKSVTFDAYGTTQGRPVLTKMTLIDRLINNQSTVMEFADYAPREFPEKYFHKDYLDKMR